MPFDTPPLQHEVLDLGETEKTPAEFRAFLDTIRSRFTAETYNLLTHNCEMLPLLTPRNPHTSLAHR